MGIKLSPYITHHLIVTHACEYTYIMPKLNNIYFRSGNIRLSNYGLTL